MVVIGAVVFRLVLLKCVLKVVKTLYSSHFFQVFLNRPLNAFLIRLQPKRSSDPPKHRIFLAIFPLDVSPPRVRS